MMAQASNGKGQGPGFHGTVGSESLQPDFEAEFRKRIGRGLQNECQTAVSEPLPPRILQLLGDLERVEPSSDDTDEEDDPYRQPES